MGSLTEFLLAIVCTGIFIAVFLALRGPDKRLKELQDNYDGALSQLKQQVTRQNRIAALEAGRALARYCRKKGKVAIFDEIALQNDLQAYGATEDE